MFVFAHYCNRKPTSKPRVNQTKTFLRDRGNSLVIVGIQIAWVLWFCWRYRPRGRKLTRLSAPGQFCGRLISIPAYITEYYTAASMPPSTKMIWPLTKFEASEARKTAAPISSWGLPHRPAGVRLHNHLVKSASLTNAVFNSVSK